MKAIIIILLLVPVLVFGQATDARHILCANGWDIRIGDTIRINHGSNPDKSFRYITNGKDEMPALDSGLYVYVKRIVKLNDEENNAIVTVKNDDIPKYKIDIENAIRSNEIYVPSVFVGVLKEEKIENVYPYILHDTVYIDEINRVVKGQKLKIGVGTLPDGDFKFIRRNSASVFAYSSTSGYQGLANQANSLPRSESGLFYKVIRVEKRGDRKHGYVCYCVIEYGIVRYEIDIINALKVGEIELEGYNPVSKTPVLQQQSIADELRKFKKLKDDGIITEEEYQAQKKKLLQ